MVCNLKDNCSGVFNENKYDSILYCCKKPFKGEKLIVEQMRPEDWL